MIEAKTYLEDKIHWIENYLESEHPEDEDVVRYPSSAEEDPSPSLSLA